MAKMTPLVETFDSEFGGSIYAVVRAVEPHVVKIGRSLWWPQRSSLYAVGSGYVAARVFTILEDWADLVAIERLLIDGLPFPKARGEEWFVADIDSVSAIIRRTLEINGVIFAEAKEMPSRQRRARLKAERAALK